LNNFPFAQQHFPQSHLRRTFRIANVWALARKSFEFVHGEILATSPFQSMLPKLAFQGDGMAVKQMVLGPLDGFVYVHRIISGFF
jgi:hypothetical protein